MNVLGLGDLPTPLRRYLLVTIAAGPLAIVVLALEGGVKLSTADLGRAAMLVVLAVVAELFPVYLTHKTHVTVSTAAYLAMIYLFPAPDAALLALAAAIVGGGAGWQGDDLVEPLFDVGQTALGVVAAAVCFAALRDVAVLGPAIGELGGLGAMVASAATFYAVNTGLVAVAAGLHLGSDPLRLWLAALAGDFAAQATMAVLGVVAAYLTWYEPVLVPALVPPVLLVHRAIRENVGLRRDTQEALASLVEVVELRDPYTAGHTRRVATMARALALRLGLTNEEADLIEGAGRVHDLGKVAIDPALLSKPGKLDEHEWAEMRRHPELGADVVARFASYREGDPLVRHHHEAWDGSGYPAGLRGEEIPLGARILAVADTFDALTSARPYRSARSVEEALAILAAGADAQWEQRVVAALFAELGVDFVAAPARRPAASEPARSSAPI